MSVMGIVLLGTGLFFVGAALGFLLGKRGKSAEHARFEAVQTEFDDYRREVSAHFGETASRFQSIGKQYKDLYEHLASGSQALCDKQAMQEGLEFVPTILAGLEETVDDIAEPVAAAEDTGITADEELVTSEAPADYAPEGEAPLEEIQPDPEVADDSVSDAPTEGHPDNVVELIPRAENEGDTEDSAQASGDDPDDAERTFK
ncbi:MAG: YhcB family protein [Woeseiaceae bacterium]